METVNRATIMAKNVNTVIRLIIEAFCVSTENGIKIFSIIRNAKTANNFDGVYSRICDICKIPVGSPQIAIIRFIYDLEM